MGEQKTSLGFVVKINSPLDHATVHRGSLKVSIHASHFGLPLLPGTIVNVKWKKGGLLSIFRGWNNAVATPKGPLSTAYEAVISIPDAGDWKIRAEINVPLFGTVAYHEIDIKAI